MFVSRIAGVGKTVAKTVGSAKPSVEGLLNAKGLNLVGSRGDIVIGNRSYSSGKNLTEFYKLNTDSNGQMILDFLGHRVAVTKEKL